MALYALVGGIVGALAAAIPGLIDLVSLRDPAIKKTGLIHMTINLTVVALYVANAWLRFEGQAGGTPFILSLVAVAMLAVSGWLGGKMVYLAGVGVSPQAPTPESAEAKRQERHA